jgi:uncharacterized protein YqfA (UPF0365 family)
MNIETIVLIVFGVVLITTFFVFLNYFEVWLRCRLSGAPVSMEELLAIRLRGSPFKKLAEIFIRTRKHGIEISLLELEDEYVKDPQNFDTFVRILIEEHKKRTGE